MQRLWMLVLVFPFSMISLDQFSLNAQPLTTPQYIQQDYSPFWIDERYSVAIPDDMRQRIFDNVPLQTDNVPLQRDQNGQWPPQQTRQGANAQQEHRNAWYGSKKSYNQALEYSREQQRNLFQNAYPTPITRENQQGPALQQRQLQQGEQFYPRQSVDQAIRRNEEVQQRLYQGAYPEVR